MGIIKVKKNDNNHKIYILNNTLQTDIDFSECQEISFYGFTKENTHFSVYNDRLILCLQDGSRVLFHMLKKRFLLHQKIKLSFVFMDSKEHSFVLGSDIFVQPCLEDFFTYNCNVKEIFTSDRTLKAYHSIVNSSATVANNLVLHV